MADVILTRGGLVSQAPAAGRQSAISKALGEAVTSQVTTISGGGGSRRPAGPTRADIEAEQKKQAAQKAAQAVAEKARQQAAQKAAQAAALRTQQTLRKRGIAERRQIGPTREIFEEQQRLRREPQVQAVDRTFISRATDMPSRLIEKITGKKPREAFRLITGAKETDITKPLTVKEVAVETTQIPIRATDIFFTGAAIGVKKIAEETVPKGIEVTIPGRKEKEISFLEPQFGTVTAEAPSGFIKRRVTIPERKQVTTTIFEPKRIAEGVRMGGIIGTTLAQPLPFIAGFASEGVEAAVDKGRTPTERALGIAEAGLAFTYIGSKTTKFLGTKVITTRAARPAAKPIAIEVQAEKIIEGKPKVVSTFFRATETRAPSVTIETTRGRELLRLKPKKVVRKKAEITMQVTPKPAIEGKIFTIAEKKLGKPSIKITRVGEVSKRAVPSDIRFIDTGREKLRQVEQLLMKKLPSKKGFKILTGREDITTSVGLARDIKRIKVTPRTLTEKPLRAKVKGVISVTELEKLGRVKLGETFIAKTITKPIVSARPSPRGKVQELETFVLKLKEKPVAKPEIIGIPKITPTKIKETKLITKETKLISKLVPVPTVTKIKATRVITEAPKTTFGKTFPATIETQLETTTALETIQPQVTQLNGMSVLPIQEMKQQPEQATIQLQPQIQRDKKAARRIMKEKQIEILKSETTQLQIQKPISKVVLTNLLAQAQIQQPILQPQIQRPQIQRPKPTQPKPTPKPFPITTPLLKRLATKAESGELFEVFATVKGKETLVGKARTQLGAEKILKKKLKKTLLAGGLIKKGERKLKSKELLTFRGGEFRKSKVSEFLVIEKKAKRLRKGRGETGEEIQMFRVFGSTKKKSKKKTGFFGF